MNPCYEPRVRIKLLFIALAFTSVTACKQSRKDAWKVICNAPETCCAGEPKSAERASKIATWTRDHVSNPDAMHDLQSLGSIEGEADRRAIVIALLEEVGVDPADCAMLRE